MRATTSPIAKTMRVFGACSTMLMLSTAPLISAAHEGEEEEAAPIQEVIGHVGDVSFAVSCKGDGVQAMFNRGVALLHNMTYEVAEREFSKVAKTDPSCAMAHWGVAMTLIHPVWPGLPNRPRTVEARSVGSRANSRSS
jgi:hypothetical protein